MYVLLINMHMIGLNSLLALIPLFCGWLMLKSRNTLLRFVLGLLWFFFLPNTLYTLTDLRYLPRQWHFVYGAVKIAVVFQYLLYELFGVSCFLFALYALEKLFASSRWRKKQVAMTVCLIVINFFIGFGIMLGRVHRLNSWDIFINAPDVLAASLHILTSIKLLLFVVLFGVLANALYFVFRKYREISTTVVFRWLP